MSSRNERSKDKLTARDQLESVRPLSRLSLTMQRDSLAPSVESPHRRVCKLRNRERFPFDAQRERADANAGGDNDSLADAQAVTQEPLLLRKHARLGKQMRGWVHFHISPEKDALQSALGSAAPPPFQCPLRVQGERCSRVRKVTHWTTPSHLQGEEKCQIHLGEARWLGHD